jgi:hypothetical protein
MIKACHTFAHVVISLSIMIFMILSIGVSTVQKICNFFETRLHETVQVDRPANHNLDRSREL